MSFDKPSEPPDGGDGPRDHPAQRTTSSVILARELAGAYGSRTEPRERMTRQAEPDDRDPIEAAVAEPDDVRPGQWQQGGQPGELEAQPDDQAETTRAWKAIAEESGELKSFPSYRAAKSELGTAPGTEIHHIVEQAQVKPERSGFDIERINTTDNLTRIPVEVHRRISALFSSKPPGFDMTIRDQQNGLPWEDQYDYGCAALDQYMEEHDELGRG